MTCTGSCCGYDDHFNEKIANRDLSNFLKGKSKKTTENLVSLLSKKDLHGKSLLDIGAGVGVLSLSLFKQGIKNSTLVEASYAYQNASKKLLSDNNFAEQSRFISGDFSRIYNEVPSADVVTLDKVVCCYDDYDSLVRSSVGKAHSVYAMVIPLDVWWTKLFNQFGNVVRSITGNTFKTYIHPLNEIEKIIFSSGFRLSVHKYQREWYISVYEKV